MSDIREPDFDKVICPNCTWQFRATPVNVQDEQREAAAEIERLREALKPFADAAAYIDQHANDAPDNDETSGFLGDLRRARAALEAAKKEGK